MYVCRCILPIGGLFAATLWTANAAYLTLSVSFIQMLKVRASQLLFGSTAVMRLAQLRHTCCTLTFCVLLFLDPVRQASMPLLVYAVGTLLGTERLSCQTWFNLVVVVAGVITASYGALQVTSAANCCCRQTLLLMNAVLAAASAAASLPI